jgi:hypothetical protein
MTIDQDDYAPRPAHDFAAIVNSLGFFKILDTLERFSPSNDEAWRSINTSESRCHQLGCEFSELPHG